MIQRPTYNLCIIMLVCEVISKVPSNSPTCRPLPVREITDTPKWRIWVRSDIPFSGSALISAPIAASCHMMVCCMCRLADEVSTIIESPVRISIIMIAVGAIFTPSECIIDCKQSIVVERRRIWNARLPNLLLRGWCRHFAYISILTPAPQ